MTYNTHYIYVPNDKKPAFKQHLLRMQPGALLVLDDVGFAIEMNRALPKTKVVFRAWYPPSHQDGDNSVHTRVKDPREMLYMYQSLIPATEDIYFHYGNEPHGSDELFDWSYEAARYTEEAKRWGCYYNASVGTPEKADWRRPSAQRFLRKITANPARHVLGLHQYIPTLVNHEFGFSTDPARWPDKWNGSSYLIGRHRELYDVCKEFSIALPRIILTEFGFDFIHAVKDWQQSLPKTAANPEIGAVWANVEAWRQAMPPGWTWQQYMVEQMHWCWQAMYRHDTIEGICIYCYGSEGRWTAYDHQNVPDLFPLMESKSWQPMTTIPPVPTTPVTPSHYVCSIGASGANVRSEPYTSKPVKGVISAAGELVKYIDSKAMADGYVWDNVTTLNSVTGWVRADVRKIVGLRPDVLLNVPYKKQFGDTTNDARINDCAAACLAMLMAFHGVDKTVDEVTAAVNQPEGTVHFKYLPPALQAFKFDGETRQNTQLVDIIASLNAGKPMMALVNYEHLRGSADFRYGHFVVPIGYWFESQTLMIRVHDPYNAASMEFPASRFAKAIGEMAGTNNSAFQSLFITRTPATEPPPPTPEDDSPALMRLRTIARRQIELAEEQTALAIEADKLVTEIDG